MEVRDTPDELEPEPYSLPNENILKDIQLNKPYSFNHPTVKWVTNNSWVKDAYHINLPTVQGTFFLNSDTYTEVTIKYPVDERSSVKVVEFHY